MPMIADDYETDFGPACPRCGGDMRWEDCTEPSCDEGEVDWSEIEPNQYAPGETEPCQNCLGAGGWFICANSYEWCIAHPLPGQENAKRFIEGAAVKALR